MGDPPGFSASTSADVTHPRHVRRKEGADGRSIQMDGAPTRSPQSSRLTGLSSAIEIFNRSATSTDLIYITSGPHRHAYTTDPVAAADETFVIPAGKSIQIPYPATSPGRRLRRQAHLGHHPHVPVEAKRIPPPRWRHESRRTRW